jgi:glutathione S-transferase
VLTLYHLFVSHFSEKARWALDYKGLPYRSRLLVPGAHLLTAKRVAGSSTVPILVDSENKVVVKDSTDILHYLDRMCSSPPLFPHDADDAARVAEIENFCDEHCAPNVGSYLYFYITQYPQVLGRLFQQGLGPAERLLVRLSLPLVRRGIQRRRALTPDNTSRRRADLLAALDQVERWISAAEGPFLVGDQFSAADLTVAALLGPAVRPAGSPWDPANLDEMPMPIGYPPEEVTEFFREIGARPVADWVREMWTNHRRPDRAPAQ